MIFTREVDDRSMQTEKADILIVDDTPENLRVLSAMLTEQGYAVRKALSGKMALLAAESLPPSLILLDVNMPDMNGYQVCQLLKSQKITEQIPIIFLSALDSTEDKVEAFKVGGVDYITKPFQFEEVNARIQTQLMVYQLQQSLEQKNEELSQTLLELRKTQTRLIQQERMAGLGQLVAGFSHEVNNPISFIAGNLKPTQEYVESLLEIIKLYQQEYPEPTPVMQAAIAQLDLDFLVKDLQKSLNSMRNGVERICNLVLALRIFSRLDESDVKTVDIHEGIESTLVLLRSRLHQAGIHIIKQYGNLPLVTCYASQLNQVILHLLSNAIDALEEKSESSQERPTIWIATSQTGDYAVQLRIRDNGPGIEPEVQSHLFEPFYTTKPVGKGKGLGLAISHEIIVEKHRGTLTCESVPGQGAEFIIDIPIASK
jgi:signal transduction histidine kinase